MPALVSSPVVRIAARRVPADVVRVENCPELLRHLAAVPDPRGRRGRRHRLVGVLGVAVCAVLAGARSLAAIGEWAADAPGRVLTAVGVGPDPLTGVVRAPGESTVRRVLAGIDADALDTAIGAWLQELSPPPSTPPVEPPTPRAPWRAVALDGKTLRGTGAAGEQVHLLAVMDHASGAVLN